MTDPAAWVAAPEPAAARRLSAEGVSPLLAPLLARRGVADGAQARRFLAPAVEHLLDPFLLTGMESAVARLLRARDRGERVAIVGDYDVDGVSGTALLHAALTACGLESETLLPHRLLDGYGFRTVQVERALASGCRVVVTVDCGTGSLEAIEHAQRAGLDVIVTDHHLPPAEFPDSAIQINPRQSTCRYPFRDLSGVGLAFKLATAMLVRCGRTPAPASLLRVACLGTIADIVPLVGENRVIAALGLRALASTRSVGLRALLQIAGVKSPLRADDVSFRLGPRINAAGRLDHADKALELLLTRDPARGRALAEELDGWNRLRQEEEQRCVDEAMERFVDLEVLPGILVAWSPDWHRGVVGIAAGRLARRFLRPTVLLAEEGDEATGSGRSIEGVHLHGFLEPWRERLLRFGGHAAAIGLSARTGELERLRDEWVGAARWDEALLQRRYEYELDLADAGAFDRYLFDELQRLEPFGCENPAPLVRVRSLRTLGEPRLFGNGHLSCVAVGRDERRIRLIGWRFAERVAELSESFEVLGQAEWDDWVEAPALRLVDLRPCSNGKA